MLIFVEGTHPVEPGMRRVEPGVGFLARRARDRDQALADEIARRIADLVLYGYRGVYGSGPALTEVPASCG